MPINSQWDIVLNDISIGAALIDFDRKWRRVHTRLLELLGYSSEELCALPFERIIELADPEGAEMLATSTSNNAAVRNAFSKIPMLPPNTSR